MTTWFTSDLHFGHTRVVDWRPFDDLDHMHAALIRNWNSVVRDDDEVIILGDVCMGNRDQSLPYLGQMAGKKFLVPGNHDHVHPMFGAKADKWHDAYSGYVNIQPVEGQQVFWGLDGADGDAGVAVDLCHFPRSGDHTDEERYSKWRPADTGRWLIHGHLHGHRGRLSGERQIDVGVDVWDFTPVSEQQLTNFIKENS